MSLYMLASYDEEAKRIRSLGASISNLKASIVVPDDLTKAFTKMNVDGVTPLDMSIDELSTSYGITSKYAKMYFADLQSGNFALKEGQTTLQGYQSWMIATGNATKTATLRTKALTVAAKAFSSIGWMVIISLAMSAISKGIEWFSDEVIHKVDNARESIEEITESIRTLNDEASNTQTTIASISGRFAELAQGVSITGGNKSLSTDEYEEFLDLSNQIAELFPTLPRIYDDNGNAIVQLTGTVDGIVDSLNDLVVAQRTLANQKIAENLPDLYKSIKISNDALKDGISETKSNVDDYQSYIELLGRYSSLDELREEMNKHSQDSFLITNMFSGLYGSDVNSVEDAINYYNNQMQEPTKEINAVIEEQQANWAKLNESLVSWLYTDGNYSIMSDEMQAGIQTALNTIDWSALDFGNSEEVQNYLMDTLVKPLANSDNAELRNAFTQLFSLDSGDLDRVEIADSLQNALNDLGIEFDVTPLVSTERDAQDRLRNSLQEISIGQTVDDTRSRSMLEMSEDYQKLIDYTKDFSVAEVDAFIEATHGIDNATEAINAYEESLAQAAAEMSYTELATSAEEAGEAVSTLRDAISDINDAFEEQNENGSISVDTMLGLVESGYAAALQFDATTGACTINAQAMADLVRVKIQNQLADLNILKSDIATKIMEQGIAAEIASKGFLALSAAKTASLSAGEALVVQNYNDTVAQITALENVMTNLDKVMSGTYSSASSSASSAAEDFTETLDAELAALDSAMEAGLKDFNSYIKERKDLIEKYYADGKIAADEYYDYLSQHYEVQLSYMDRVIDYATTVLDKETDKYDDLIESVEDVNNALADQQELMENAAEAVVSYIDSLIDGENDAIDALNDANEAIEERISKYDSLINVADRLYEKEQEDLQKQQDTIQDSIDLLQEENDERDLAYRKEQALYALQEAQRNRTRKIYTGDRGYIYDTDQDAVRDAQNDLADIETEELINSLEKESDALQEAIDALQLYRDALGEISDAYQQLVDERNAAELIGEDYENVLLGMNIDDWLILKDRYIAANDEMANNEDLILAHEQKIEAWEDEKEQWSSLSSVIEEETQKQAATILFGADWEAQINEGRLQSFDEFKEAYVGIQERINNNDAIIESYNEKIEYYDSLKDQWGSITYAYDEMTNEVIAKQILGEDAEKQILDGRISTLNTFKNNYIAIQQKIVDETYKANQAIANAQKVPLDTNVPLETSSLSSISATTGAITGGIFGISAPTVGKGSGSGSSNLTMIAKFHDGLNSGLVNNHTFDDDFETVRRAGLAKGEVPAILMENEAVLTPDQTSKLASRLRILDMMENSPVVDTSAYARATENITNSRQTTNVTIGEISLHEVQNVPDFAKALEKHLPGISVQYNGRH